MKMVMPALIALLLSASAALGQQDERVKSVLERIEKELEKSHARLIQDVEQVIREEIRKARAAKPPEPPRRDPSAELAAFVGKLKDDNGLNTRLKKFLQSKEGREAALKEMSQLEFKTMDEAINYFCVRDKDGRLSIRAEHAEEVQAWLDQAAAPGGKPQVEPKPPEKRPYLGISAGDLTDEERKSLGVAGGIRVAEVRGPAEKAGLRPGDVLLAIGAVPVTEETIGRTLERHRPGDTVEVTLLRDRKKEVFKVTLGERTD